MQIVATPPNGGTPALIDLTARQASIIENAATMDDAKIYEMEVSIFIPAEAPTFVTEPTEQYTTNAKRKATHS